MLSENNEENMKKFFEEQLNETLIYTNSLLEENKSNLNLKEALLEAKEKLLNSKFNKENFIDDIDSFLLLRK